jgi:hypothetical protein
MIIKLCFYVVSCMTRGDFFLLGPVRVVVHTIVFRNNPMRLKQSQIHVHSFIFLSLPLEHRASVKRFVSLQLLNLRQSIRLLGRVISPLQGRYLNRGQHKHRKTHTHTKHPCLEWDLNTRPQCSCLRPRDHCDRLITNTRTYKNEIQILYLQISFFPCWYLLGCWISSAQFLWLEAITRVAYWCKYTTEIW